MVGAKFSTWGKADRFAYRENYYKHLPEKVGPGSYNSNPFLNIEATVNASHHIYGFPIIGVPKGGPDEAFSLCDGAMVFDERFATLKYKRQQRRTERET